MTSFAEHGKLTPEGQKVAAFFDAEILKAAENVEAINGLPGHVKSWYVHVRKMQTMTPAEWMEANSYAASHTFGTLAEQEAAADKTKQSAEARTQQDSAVAESLASIADALKDVVARLAKLEAGEDDDAEDDEPETAAPPAKPAKAPKSEA